MAPISKQIAYGPKKHRSSFTLIELLIVIAIIAVLATVVILVLNPAQLLMAARDSNRVSDLHTLNQALTLYSEDVGTGMGASSVVYVSIPDPSATSTLGDQCQGLGFSSSSLPTGWTYHCAGPKYYRDVNGEGWIPVDFTKMSSGSPMGSLPVDPVNQTSSGLYYTYVVQGDPWELTSNMESTKYQMGGSSDVVSTDGGQYPDLYEVGTDLSLMPVDYNPSLVGYWKLDEGSGTVAYDASGHGNTGTWNGTEAGTSGYYSQGHGQTWAGYFDGVSDDVSVPSMSFNTATAGYTFTAWIYPTALATHASIGNYETTIGMMMEGNTIYCWLGGAAAHGISVTLNAWNFIACTYTGFGSSARQLWLNGTLGNTDTGGSADYTGNIDIGKAEAYNQYFQGLIDDVSIYNRALSASEIQAIYNSKE